MKNIRFLVMVVITFSSLSLPTVQATEASPEELMVVYIYQLSRFVEWSAEKLQPEIFTVCTFPVNPLGELLFKLEKKQIHAKPVKVKEVTKLDELAMCHVLFLEGLNTVELAKVNDLAQQMHILTLSRQNGFIEQNGMIQLFEQNQRIRFSVNYGQSKSAALQISSKLLKLATKVIK